jgi:hypothetical protein
MSKPALAKPTGRKYQKLEDSERSRAPGAGRKTNATKVAINIQKVADQAVVVQQQKNLTNFLDCRLFFHRLKGARLYYLVG